MVALENILQQIVAIHKRLLKFTKHFGAQIDIIILINDLIKFLFHYQKERYVNWWENVTWIVRSFWNPRGYIALNVIGHWTIVLAYTQ